MRVEPTSALLQAMLATPSKRAEAAPFQPGAAAAPPAAQPAVSNPVQSVQMLVALAAAGNEPERRRIAAEQAEQGLDELSKLHRELIAGVASAQRLRALRDWTRKRTRPDDPKLAGLMDDVELRILVELAKQER